MHHDYISFEYSRPDGTILSEEDFFSEHPDVLVTPKQKQRLIQNLEVQCILALKAFGAKNYIILKGFYKNFIFQDPDTHELYLTPLEEIKVFFRKATPILVIYDMKMA